MPGILSAIISITFIAVSIYLGSNYLTEPDTSTLKNSMLTFYKSVYERAKGKDKGGVIGFGYTGCKDISVNTFYFLDRLEVKFAAQEKTQIITIQDFVETFASFFSVGASTEIFMENEENFEELISKIGRACDEKTFGGNAPHMALRAAKENYNAVLVADIGQDEIKTIKELDTDSKIHIVPVNETRNASDIHLIFEYPATRYKGIISPKGNKFYLNHDTISSKLLALDKYLEVADKFNVTKHALSGFHLIQKLPVEEGLGLIGKVLDQWNALRLRGPQTIHMEMGAFQKSIFYQSVIEKLLTKADSLGINEQEILILHTFLKENAFKTLTIPYSDSSLLLQKLFDIIEILEQKKATLSRLHIHEKSMHHLCYRGNCA